MTTTNLKAIAHRTGRTVAEVNAVARDLDIAEYDAGRHAWVINHHDEAYLTEQLDNLDN